MQRQHKNSKEFKIINKMELIDLKLPSGTKWAACNIGAEKPTEYGDYFAWGII